jgi:hypothetical protein
MSKNSKPRYLTKSRYKMAMECPTKLFYTGKPSEYIDTSIDDPFLKALARGGFQVGALAKCYYPDGIEVEETSHDAALEVTNRLLQKTNVTIFEAAIRYRDLFIRVDILKKAGHTLEVIEVKSKSFDPGAEDPFFDKTALRKKVFKLSSEFAPYLYDIAFQSYVCQKALPGMSVSSYLLLPNKASRTSVDGLNQLFLLKENPGGKTSVMVRPSLKRDDLGEEILCKINVDEAVQLIHSGKNAERGKDERCNGLEYDSEIDFFAKMYSENQKIASQPGSHCKKCEFKAGAGERLKSGFEECWRAEKGLTPAQLSEPFVFDIWNFRKADPMIEEGKILMKDLAQEDLAPAAKAGEIGLSTSQRQWMQVEFVKSGRSEPYVDVKGLSSEFSAWRYPLHFIDFETTMVAIPFTKGRRPYEQIAFQFSHHMVHEDGRIEHADQYLNGEVGKFPNFEFVRSLKKVLEKDQGTIFRYAAHENTVLCQIHEQLRGSSEPDAAELMDWIRTISTSSAKSTESWNGHRSMVDLCELIKRYYFHPLTKGSNSIKRVLPAILADSARLRERYSKPIYGGPDGIESLNFQSWSWIEFSSDGSVKDPYKRLPSVYHGLDRDQLDFLLGEDDLADGGAAMTAYAMMQFTEMTDEERAAVSNALLRYCELDTFAMVLLYEYWVDILGLTRSDKVA